LKYLYKYLVRRVWQYQYKSDINQMVKHTAILNTSSRYSGTTPVSPNNTEQMFPFGFQVNHLVS
jgi:hypothetical protein